MNNNSKMEKLEKGQGVINEKMIKKLRNWGNSQGACISKDTLKSLDWMNGESVEVLTDKDQIIINKWVPPKSPQNIKQLFSGYEGKYHAEEIDWGKSEGKEAW